MDHCFYDDIFAEAIGRAVDAYYERGGNPLPDTERTIIHKFSVPGVEK